ncbi:MAG: hypothetical protein WC712_08400 [Candidatus Brocadiia bacterium]
MKMRSFARLSLAFCGFFLAAAMVAFCATNVANAEEITIAGAQLALVTGGLEDMMRFSGGDYKAPKAGDLVKVLDECPIVTAPPYWPDVIFFWEDSGPKAELDFRDHIGYLNDRAFALILSSSSAWKWLEKATENELSGIRYIEFSGAPPAGFPSFLARLPRGRIVVRCTEELLGLPLEALAALDPIGLIPAGREISERLNLSGFKSCAYLSLDLYADVNVELPPALKTLEVKDGHNLLKEVRGAEESLVTACFSGVSGYSEWLVNYKALKDITALGFPQKAAFLDFADSVVKLPKLISLDIESAEWSISFLSSMPGLRALWLESGVKDLTPLDALRDLECAKIIECPECDFSALSDLTKLKYLAVTIEVKSKEEDEDPVVMDLVSLAPIAGKLTLLGFEGALLLEHTEALNALASLEELVFNCDTEQAVSISCLSSLRKIRKITGLMVADPDLSPLGMVKSLESLGLVSDGPLDLSGLRGCSALTELSIIAFASLDLAPLADMKSLIVLRLIAAPGQDEEEGEAKVPDCSPLAKLENLRFLALKIRNVSSIDFVSSLTALRGFEMRYSRVRDLSALGGLNNLRYLDLSYNNLLEADAGISLPGSLRALSLRSCLKISDLSFIGTARKLEVLVIDKCPGIRALPGPQCSLPQLKELFVNECKGLVDTAGLATMSAIESLCIISFTGTSLAGMEALKDLRFLGLSDALMLQRVPVASPEAPLVNVEMSGAKSLRSLDGIETWRSISVLRLSLGKKITDLTPLSSLVTLEALLLDGGESVKDVAPLTELTGLKSLHIGGCAFATKENIAVLEKALPGCRITGKK